MARAWKNLDPPLQQSLMRWAPLLGATNAYPGTFPTAFDSLGIGHRDLTRHQFGGMIVTRPESDIVAFGLTHRARDTGVDKEDIRVLDLNRRELTQPSSDEWLLRYPQYGPSRHHGDKAFLFKTDL